MGRSIARWMVSRGARHLILLSRSGLSAPAAQSLADELGGLGVTVAAPSCDVSDDKALKSALGECTRLGMPPVKGCIQGAMVLRDNVFENMSHDDFNAALRPKIEGSWNLHANLPHNLDFFVLLSSVGGLVGTRGQCNYAAGCTYQDALARHRLVRGLPAVSLDLGMVLEVGYVAETPKVMESLRASGHVSINEAELLAIMDQLCDPATFNTGLPGLFRGQVATGFATPAQLRHQGLTELHWMRRPFFRHLLQMDLDLDDTDGPTGDNSSLGAIDYATLLPAAPSLAAAAQLVETDLVRKLSKV